MKIDYKFLKSILIAMEEYKLHQIRCYDLMQKIGVMDERHVLNEELTEKFVGHIKILGDNYFIESSDKQGNYGFGNMNNGYAMSNPLYRITAKGYEFLDILKNDTILNKVKNFAIKNAWEIGKQLIIESAKINML